MENSENKVEIVEIDGKKYQKIETDECCNRRTKDKCCFLDSKFNCTLPKETEIVCIGGNNTYIFKELIKKS